MAARGRSATNESFHPCAFAGLQYVDRLGEVAGAPGAAAELAQDPPGLGLGVRAFAGARNRAWARLAFGTGDPPDVALR